MSTGSRFQHILVNSGVQYPIPCSTHRMRGEFEPSHMLAIKLHVLARSLCQSHESNLMYEVQMQFENAVIQREGAQVHGRHNLNASIMPINSTHRSQVTTWIKRVTPGSQLTFVSFPAHIPRARGSENRLDNGTFASRQSPMESK